MGMKRKKKIVSEKLEENYSLFRNLDFKERKKERIIKGEFEDIQNLTLCRP